MKHIAIEGNIGSGKTTLSQFLVEALGGRPMLEEFEQNPLLPLFYADRRKHALSLEIAFMAQRFLQWSHHTTQTDLFSDYLISDYHYEKSRVFAGLNLEETEFALFDRLFVSLQNHLRPPDLLIFVRRPIAVLQENIVLRGRTYESQIERDYLERIDLNLSAWLTQARPKKLLRLEPGKQKFEEMPSLIAKIADFVHDPHNSFVTLS